MNKLLEEFYESSNENDVPEFLNNEVSGGETPTEPPVPTEPPANWDFLVAIDSDQTWTPPEPGAWYRVWVIGKSGDGGAPYKGGTYNNAGGSGGNSGGLAGSALQISEPVQCTVNSSTTDFGGMLQATAGGNGNQNGSQNSVVGQASGGNLYNLTGFKGGAAGRNGGSQGENNGARGGSCGSTEDYDSYGGGGGGGARLPVPYEGFPYIPTSLSAYRAGCGATADCDLNGTHGSWGSNANAYPALNLSAPMLYGGGCGGGGSAYASFSYGSKDYSEYNPGGSNTAGSPGLIIIEKGRN